MIGETIDPFSYKYDYDESKEFITLSRDSFAILENKLSDNTADYRYEIKINANDFMKVCKNNNATPVILASILMSKGIFELYPDLKKTINANIATNIRDALGCPNTYKNCVKSMILPYSKELAKKLLKEQATKFRQILNA